MSDFSGIFSYTSSQKEFFLASMMVFYLTWVLLFIGCQARRIPQPRSTTNSHTLWMSHELYFPSDESHFAIENSPTERSQIKLDISKRGQRVRPSRPNPTKPPENTTTIRLFEIDLVYTNKEFEIIRAMFRKIPELVTLGIVGIEVEPRHNLYFRLGALHLNLYALTEALSQSVVLAVMNRLAEMATRGFICLGLGEVVVGAGIRVLFAAGIRLQGLQDINEFFEPLIG